MSAPQRSSGRGPLGASVHTNPRLLVPVGWAEHESASTPRLALSVDEACQALGVSWDFWREHVAPEVRIVRAGRRKLVPVSELVRWLGERAEVPL